MLTGICELYADDYRVVTSCQAGTAFEYVLCWYSVEAVSRSRCTGINDMYAAKCM